MRLATPDIRQSQTHRSQEPQERQLRRIQDGKGQHHHRDDRLTGEDGSGEEGIEGDGDPEVEGELRDGGAAEGEPVLDEEIGVTGCIYFA